MAPLLKSKVLYLSTWIDGKLSTSQFTPVDSFSSTVPHALKDLICQVPKTNPLAGGLWVMIRM